MEIENLRTGRAFDTLRTLNLNPQHLGVIAGPQNSSVNAPYHNSQHLLTVAKYAYDMGIHYKLKADEMRVLYLAALYHDFDHTMSSQDDNVNILRAVTSAQKHISALEPNSELILPTVVSLISSTVSPNTPEPQSMLEEILQDADVLQNIESDAVVFWEGLHFEKGLTVTKDSTAVFLREHKFNTAWAENSVKNYLTA
jgi:HD superfamily phosphodiesterase